ncbi:hypothetical protein CS542_10010 [Pedobacter sp. IW39]|nr:hypothetical protein CS542_10010 [Pedobacter sp. IW39]
MEEILIKRSGVQNHCSFRNAPLPYRLLPGFTVSKKELNLKELKKKCLKINMESKEEALHDSPRLSQKTY